MVRNLWDDAGAGGTHYIKHEEGMDFHQLSELRRDRWSANSAIYSFNPAVRDDCYRYTHLDEGSCC